MKANKAPKFQDIDLYSKDFAYQVTIQKEVVKYISQYLQNSAWKKEAGGQLFGDFKDHQFIVSIATGPRKTDLRSRFGYKPDTKKELLEIEYYQKIGKWFLGDWHTHPQKIPSPSPLDIHTIQKSYSKSHTALPGFLLLIGGKSHNNLYAGLVKKSEVMCLY